MKLRLSKLPADQVIGIYGPNARVCDRDLKHPNYKHWDLLVMGGMPERARAMRPEAAFDYLRAAEEMVVSDMLRSPETSLRISQEPGRSALPPGYSGHNYGLSIDIHQDAMRSRLGFKKKVELDAWMAQFNFYNFWVDGKESHDKEDWHYNHLPPEFRDRGGGFSSKVTTGYLENMIQKLYGADMKLDAAGAQAALKKLGDYDGAVDGKFGKLSKAALHNFQTRWMPGKVSGELDTRTQRLLAFLTAEIEWVPLNVTKIKVPGDGDAFVAGMVDALKNPR